jgi:CheY-like chemotaxis protein
MIMQVNPPYANSNVARTRRPARGLHLLIVDDMAMNRDIAGSFLRAAGHHVSGVETGREALNALASGHYDLVLMDVRMPDMDGLEVTRRLRAMTHANANVPVIALTLHASSEQVAACRMAGMNDHLAKPFSQETLLGAVDAMMTERRGPIAASRSEAATLASPGGMDLAGSTLPVRDRAAFDGTAAVIAPELVRTFLETISVRCEALLGELLEPSPAEPVITGLAEAAHTLAGSAGMFGFARLSFVSRQFERAVETASREIRFATQSLVAALEATLAELRIEAPPANPTAPSTTGTVTVTPKLTDEILLFERDFVVEVAGAPDLMDTLRFRREVYCVERGLQTSGGVAYDDFDGHSRHVVVRHRGDGQIVATARVVLHDPDAPNDSFPTQRVCGPALLDDLPLTTTADLSRYAISMQSRGASPGLLCLALMRGLFQISGELGLTDWCMTMENSLLRLLESFAIHPRPLGPLVECQGPRQPCRANIAETAARVQIERPEIWAFVTDNGRYHDNKEVIANASKHATRMVSAAQAEGPRSESYSSFERAWLFLFDAGAPPQQFRPIMAAH